MVHGVVVQIARLAFCTALACSAGKAAGSGASGSSGNATYTDWLTCPGGYSSSALV